MRPSDVAPYLAAVAGAAVLLWFIPKTSAAATVPPRIVFDAPNGTLEWSNATALTSTDAGVLLVTAADVRVVNTTSGTNASVSTDTAGVHERAVARDLNARRAAVPVARPTSTWTPGASANLTTTCSVTPGVVVLPPAWVSTPDGLATPGTSRLAVFTAGSTCTVATFQDVVGAVVDVYPGADRAWDVGAPAVSGGGLAALMSAGGASSTPGFTSWDAEAPDGTVRRFLLRTALNSVVLVPTTCPVASFQWAPVVAAADAPTWAAEPNAVPCVGVIATAADVPAGASATHVATAGWSSSDGAASVFTGEYVTGWTLGGDATFTLVRKLFIPKVADVAYTSTGQLVLCVDADAGDTGGVYVVPGTTDAVETVDASWRVLAVACTSVVAGRDATSGTDILLAASTVGGVDDPTALPLATVLTGNGASGDDTVWTVAQRVPLGAVTARGVSVSDAGPQFMATACNPDWGSAASGLGDVTAPGCTVWAWWDGALRRVGGAPFGSGAVSMAVWHADRATGVLAAHAHTPESLDTDGPDWVQLWWLSP